MRNTYATPSVGWQPSLALLSVGDPLSLTIPDPGHWQLEDRFIIVGASHQPRLLVVAHTESGDNIRIISARRASRREQRSYEEGT
jgi:uncharacterized DUF497 family protein